MWIRFLIYYFLVVFVAQAQECPDDGGIVTTCVIDPEFHCFGDHHCRNGYKCCSYGCNRRCLAINYGPIHLAFPNDKETSNNAHQMETFVDLFKPEMKRSCENANTPVNTEICFSDNVCKSNQKCCSFQCSVVRPFIVPIN